MDFELFDVFEGSEAAPSSSSAQRKTPAAQSAAKRGREELAEDPVESSSVDKSTVQEPVTVFTEHTEHTLSVTGSDRTITTVSPLRFFRRHISHSSVQILALPADYVPTGESRLSSTDLILNLF
jgi:hypothetical protein